MDPITALPLIIMFIIGFVMLVKGADIFIDGAASIATRRGVSEHLIGLTLVAFATSIPELAVSDIAAFQGVEGIAIGNVVGSNIANIGLVLGVAIFIMPISAPKQSYTDGLILLGITCLMAFMIYGDEYIGRSSNQLDRIDGLILLAVYGAFSFYLIRNHLRCHGKDAPDAGTDKCPVPTHASEVDGLIKVDIDLDNEAMKDWFKVVAGVILVLVGAQFLVESATTIADELGVSEFIIGLTIVSIGTSLPELASSVTAAMKKKHGISIGNVLGSNIINIALVLGSAAAIRPIPASGTALDLSMPFLFLLTIICVILVRTRMPKAAGIMLLLLYVAFLGALAIGGGI